MPNRLTKDIMERTNEQRRRLGRPLLSHAGFVAAVSVLAQEHVEHVLVTHLVNHVVEPENISDHTSPFVAPTVDGDGT